MMARLAALAILLTLTVACARDAGAGSASPAASDSGRPTSASSYGLESITGRLGADSIEGGCGYLEADDETRYEVIYPPGWELSLTPLQLTAPDGSVVARGGQTVTVRGSRASDMASTCQIGPIFRATEVETP